VKLLTVGYIKNIYHSAQDLKGFEASALGLRVRRRIARTVAAVEVVPKYRSAPKLPPPVLVLEVKRGEILYPARTDIAATFRLEDESRESPE
jgi:hypothetical protein